MSSSNKYVTDKPLSLVWLRRDLRVYDHAALSAALQQAGEVQPVFVFDTAVLSRFSNTQDRRLSFIAEALCQLHSELAKKGGGLLVLHGNAQEIIPRLAGLVGAANIFAAEDYEPATITRDAAVAAHAPLKLVKDHLLLAPKEVQKADGTPYRVFTPYYKAWLSLASHETFEEKPVTLEVKLADRNQIAEYVSAQGFDVLDAHEGAAAMLEKIGYTYTKDTLWTVQDARSRLKRFGAERITAYDSSRDYVAKEGTSAISPYLRFGLVSVREAARIAAGNQSHGAQVWLKELVWREFYAMILYRFPETATQEFNAAYRGTLAWRYDTSVLERFCAGRTGYPIVDAAMRQLLHTGWMHNRARMIVASFFTKDLLMDWRLGEEHFAQFLMDYDMASNVGGWQWAASTGTDAQPWFRIFNPTLQSTKFDAEGEYIRRYVPEIAHLDNKQIHEAGKYISPDIYPQPMVAHDKMRAEALAMFKAAANA